MLTELCRECRNWFTSDEDKHVGTFTVKDGTITPLDFLQDGQYFRIVGSTFNDGVHQYPQSNLIDEVFNGSVWAMKIPPSFLALNTEIDDYSKSDAAAISPYASESWGGYSYTKATNAAGKPDSSWQNVFASRLNVWRKL